jgi:ABC-2 type transport system ATP-binding protein
MAGGLAVEARGVVKRFGAGITAVSGLDLGIEEGEIYGLLGPNGAGKTTTLRMLLGLVRPTSGVIRVLGRPPGDPAGLRQVGAMGEIAFYPFLSGRDNLRAVARRASVADSRVDDVLGQVSLTARASDPVAAYSFGMRQRLAVAAALLKDPRLLIMDEPSNGLDPAGQQDMRRLIRELAAEDRTVVLSSHDMEEAEQLCGRIGIIGSGRVLAEGGPGKLRGQARLQVRVRPASEAAALAAALAGVANTELLGDTLLLAMPDAGPARAAQINRQLVDAGLEVSEVRTTRRSLREVFLELTGGRTGSIDSVRERGAPAGRAWWHRRRHTAGNRGDGR